MAGLFLGIGAGPGIGLSTARRFAAEGFRVVLAARKVEQLEALADDLRRGPNAGVEIASVDCSDSPLVGELVDHYAPGLEVIHYNAAVIRAQTLQEQSLASIAEDIEVDIASALVAVRQAGAAMAPRRRGSILLTGGILGVKPVSSLLTLSVGKAGLRCAAEALFPDFAAQGVHIAVLTIGTGIAPGSRSAEAGRRRLLAPARPAARSVGVGSKLRLSRHKSRQSRGQTQSQRQTTTLRLEVLHAEFERPDPDR